MNNTQSLQIIDDQERKGGSTYDPYLEKWGNYFQYFSIRERYGWTFEHFLKLLERGTYTKENGY